ncbi:MAG TPA: methyltransferase domain-containing protein [Vicinamibacterales bacterium]|nr:methyltransferase domain-containing protein [Vicinamibacterales bacterium]
MEREHQERILDQFGQQAAPFAASPQIRNEEALNRIVGMAAPTPDDNVLDVACGPGRLACAFARVTRHVTGIDVTPQMLEQARALQQKEGLENLTWRQAAVPPLPYADASFSIVCARFAFHHFLDPLAVLKEMRRVCRSGGRVVVADAAPESNRADAFNEMERLRDPSHVRALSPEELVDLFATAGLPEPRLQRDLLPYELESLLARSFPKDGDADRIRRMFDESLQGDSLGVGAVRKDGKIWFSFPTAIVASTITGSHFATGR